MSISSCHKPGCSTVVFVSCVHVEREGWVFLGSPAPAVRPGAFSSSVPTPWRPGR